MTRSGGRVTNCGAAFVDSSVHDGCGRRASSVSAPPARPSPTVLVRHVFLVLAHAAPSAASAASTTASTVPCRPRLRPERRPSCDPPKWASRYWWTKPSSEKPCRQPPGSADAAWRRSRCPRGCSYDRPSTFGTRRSTDANRARLWREERRKRSGHGSGRNPLASGALLESMLEHRGHRRRSIRNAAPVSSTSSGSSSPQVAPQPCVPCSRRPPQYPRP